MIVRKRYSITEHIITKSLAVSHSVVIESQLWTKLWEFLAVGVVLVRID